MRSRFRTCTEHVEVWEVDPLICLNCGGDMKIISFITEPGVIRQILQHIGLGAEKALMQEVLIENLKKQY